MLLVVTVFCALSSAWAGNGHGNGKGNNGNGQDVFLVASANRNPIAGICASPSAFATPTGGAAIEIIQPPSATDPDWQAYLGGGAAIPMFFASWPNSLPFNPATPAIGPLVKNTEDARQRQLPVPQPWGH